MTIDMDHRTAPQRRSAGSPVPAPRIDGPPRGTRQRPAPAQFAAPRRLAAGVLAGALTMLVVALLDTVDRRAGAGARVVRLPAGAGGAAGGRSRSRHPPATPGTCLNWTRPDAVRHRGRRLRAAAPVRAGRHRAAGRPDRRCPTTAGGASSSASAATRSCTQYLDGRFDPDGRFRVGALKPSPAKWARATGSCAAACRARRARARCTRSAGKAVEQDQSAVHDPGTCLGIDGRTIGDPVDCAGPHAVEAVGVVDLAEEVRRRRVPGRSTTQDEFLQTGVHEDRHRVRGRRRRHRREEAHRLLGQPHRGLLERRAPARSTATWPRCCPTAAGSRPVTGSVRGPVTVGDTPAPPATGHAGARCARAGAAGRAGPDPGRPPAEPAPSATPPPPGTDAPPLDGTPEPPPADDDRPRPILRAGAAEPPAPAPAPMPLRHRHRLGARPGVARRRRVLTADWPGGARPDRDDAPPLRRTGGRRAGHDPAGAHARRWTTSWCWSRTATPTTRRCSGCTRASR